MYKVHLPKHDVTSLATYPPPTATVFNYWRDAIKFQQEKNTPLLKANSLFRAVFSYSEQIYCENIT